MDGPFLFLFLWVGLGLWDQLGFKAVTLDCGWALILIYLLLLLYFYYFFWGSVYNGCRRGV